VLIALPNAHLPGGVAKVKGKWKIYFRPGTLDLNHVIAHEIGHIVLTESEFPSPLVIEMEEEYANAIGAALLAPRDLVRRAYEIYGEDKLRPLAKTFAISMTSAQLRLGETRGDERAVITETGHLLTRTQGAFPWRESPVEDLRHSPQLAKVRLSGGIDRGRTALRAK
jgi:Zn-dependent peptidase ImmA (M78 family)